VAKKIGVVFSSGFFGFFAHAVFFAAIRKLGISPVAFSGSSSGAILAAMAACEMTDEQIRAILFGLSREDFWDPDPWYERVGALVRLFRGYTGYLNGRRFQRLLQRSLPVHSFEQCRIPVAVAATNLTSTKEEIFHSGDLIKAIAASGAVPGLFKPVAHNGAIFVDGGVVNKAPVNAILGLGRVDEIIVHFIPSAGLCYPWHGVLGKKLTPWLIHRRAVDIARHECYKRQCQMVISKGVKLTEVKGKVVAVGPKTLHRGPLAYKMAMDLTVQRLTEGPTSGKV